MRSSFSFWIKSTLIVATIISGCATIAKISIDDEFGVATPENRAVTSETQVATLEEQATDINTSSALTTSLQKEHNFYTAHAKPIIESRCVVCHACYDAPCQLKMSSPEGIERGANKEAVYEGSRLLAATPNRLFVDAFEVEQWRERAFFPVLNERVQTPKANTQASVIARMLMLKKQHPLPDDKILDARFDGSLIGNQQCPTIEEFEQFAKSEPLAGMPYGLPGLNNQEDQILMTWLENGANMPKAQALPKAEQDAVNKLEAFLNADSLNMQLSARYIYEHLFSTHLYFGALSEQGLQPQFYNLVRSVTPTGQEIQIIAGRRPYDAPNTSRVYYRLQPITSTIVNKTHQPYAINKDLMDKWEKWFVTADYTVTKLPSYKPKIAANPLTAFEQLPVNSRYRFMLERAENTIMGYIKGPVCRGQVALNVINDRFWVYFLDPDMADDPDLKAFYAKQKNNLRMPAEEQSTTLAVDWIEYANRQADYLKARNTFFNTTIKDGKHLTVKGIWDGDKVNENASLTVFRHFDNATVVKGLIGQPPKTAWVIDYVLLERIHYLLVAGFDVYGNYGHQLLTRLYMDFLRLEGEANFLALLPPDNRKKELKSWYQKAGVELSDFIETSNVNFNQESSIEYKSSKPKKELYNLLNQHLSQIQPNKYHLKTTELTSNSVALLDQINSIKGEQVAILPELTMIMVDRTDSNTSELFTLVRNSAHYNVNSLFFEEDNRDIKNDTVTLVHGLIGSYPDSFLHVKETDIANLVVTLQNMKTEKDYEKMLDVFAIRRTNPDFWLFSDKLHKSFMQHEPIRGGWLDFNRLESR
ncbi:fatty acid cis/trans isomerase [uncultured Psychrosphaera sp.]|uniref:fatty acid cis/trans isomerase n=1 Tax=uncultured Psychrosphaera sp. TaxID=1403522 RepID=UPI0026226D58|nr:fatty acid cis/trans isomerase [uncultured Psychrosphaera sp.]